MACGALSTGFISDKLFKSNRSRPIAIFMFLAMIVMILIYLVPPHMKIVGMILLFLAGIFVYGPQSCYWALCPDLFGRHRSATAIGIMNFCAYLFAAVGEPVIGIVIDSTGSTSSVFAFLAGMSALGVLSILPVRR
jgi:OPA family glycerol-3-phosphate transporter-like MFS transporter